MKRSLEKSSSSRILVTGGCGFIGVNLIHFILEHTDYEIVVLDNLTVGKEENLWDVVGDKTDRVTFIKGDIRRADDVRRSLAGCDVVCNLAAQPGVAPSVEDPVTDKEINLDGLFNLLQEARNAQLAKLIHISSAAVVGAQEPPMHEDMVPVPISPYGASKLAGEAYCSAYASAYDLPCVVLRLTNTYGTRGTHKTSATQAFISTLAQGEPIAIYGDGEQTRDFIFVEDVCRAILLSIATELKSSFERFQLGSGVETTVNELVTIVSETLQEKGFSTPKPVYKPPREGEVRKNYADISKAKKVLGFTPQVELQEGVRRCIEWELRQS